MRVYAICALQHGGSEDAKPRMLSRQLGTGRAVPFFASNSASELVVFASRECVQRAPPGKGVSVEHNEFVVHLYTPVKGGLATAVVCDREYPAQPAFRIVAQAAAAFRAAHDESAWTGTAGDLEPLLKTPAFAELLEASADPESLSKVTQLQREVEEVRDIMHTNIEQLLRNNESLEDLIDKTDDLKAQSKVFAKQSREVKCRLKQFCVVQ